MARYGDHHINKKHQDNRAECKLITYTHIYFIGNSIIKYLKCFLGGDFVSIFYSACLLFFVFKKAKPGR